MLTLDGNSLEAANYSSKSRSERNTPQEKIQRDTNTLQGNSLEAANYNSKSRSERNTLKEKIQRNTNILQGNSLETAITAVNLDQSGKKTKGKIQRDTNTLQGNSLEAANYSSKINLDQSKTPRWQRDRCSHYKETHYKQQIIVVFKSLSERNTPLEKIQKIQTGVRTTRKLIRSSNSYNLVVES